MIPKLLRLIRPDRFKDIKFLFIILTLATLLELLALVFVEPVVLILTNQTLVNNSIFSEVDYWNSKQLISLDSKIIVIILFGILSALSALMKIVQYYLNLKVSYGIGSDVITDIYGNYLHQSYISHTKKNSSEIVSLIVAKANAIVQSILLPFSSIASAFILVPTILYYLIATDLGITLIMLASILVSYGSIMIFSRKLLKKHGKAISDDYPLYFRYLAEGLGGIREIILNSSQDFHKKLFVDIDIRMRNSYTIIGINSILPRYLIESVFFVVISLLISHFLFTKSGLNFEQQKEFLPNVSVFLFGFLRILPSVQQAYSSWSHIKSNIHVIDEINNLLNEPTPERYLKDTQEIYKLDSLELKNVYFGYDQSIQVLKHISLKIQRGQKVAIIGTTGSGKSTLIDLIMGLLEPNQGEIYINGSVFNSLVNKSWRKLISHVPQEIFLIDSSIIENIAFGIPATEIDYERIKYVSGISKLDEFVNKLPDKYNTKVGERGIGLSGGQKQRIGIARALYKNSPILILDEATSALDEDTEKSIMDSIFNMDKNLMIIMVTHKLANLKFCDSVIEMNNGLVVSNKNLSKKKSTQTKNKS